MVVQFCQKGLGFLILAYLGNLERYGVWAIWLPTHDDVSCCSLDVQTGAYSARELALGIRNDFGDSISIFASRRAESTLIRHTHAGNS